MIEGLRTGLNSPGCRGAYQICKEQDLYSAGALVEAYATLKCPKLSLT